MYLKVFLIFIKNIFGCCFLNTHTNAIKFTHDKQSVNSGSTVGIKYGHPNMVLMKIAYF